MAVVAHFAEFGGNCGRRRHRGEVLGEVGKRMSAKSGAPGPRRGERVLVNRFETSGVWCRYRCFTVTQGIIGSRPGPPVVS